MPVRTARHLDLIVSGPRQYFAIRFTYRSFGAQGVEARRWISWKWNVFERAEYRGADDVYWNELLYDCWQSDVKPAPFASYWFRISCEMRRWSTARLSTVIDIKLTFYDPHFSLMSPDFGSTTENLNQLRPNFVLVNCSPLQVHTLINVGVVYAQANELDDRLEELIRCISEMWSGRKTAEEENEFRGGRKYIQYLQSRWAWPRSWLLHVSVWLPT